MNLNRTELGLLRFIYRNEGHQDIPYTTWDAGEDSLPIFPDEVTGFTNLKEVFESVREKDYLTFDLTINTYRLTESGIKVVRDFKDSIVIPFNELEIEAFEKWQSNPMVHPYTCNGNDKHPHKTTILVGEKSGLKCSLCNWNQTWIHKFVFEI